MKQFATFIAEASSSSLAVYHGDNFKTTKLIPKLMTGGNNQEGIGIYFSDKLETAQDYGKYIVSTKINMKDFVNSRDGAGKHIDQSVLTKLLLALSKSNPEEFFYYVSDYVEVADEADVDMVSIMAAAKQILDNEIRNLQIELSAIVGVETFVKLWNKIVGIDGTYYNNRNDETWFAIINPKYKMKLEK